MKKILASMLLGLAVLTGLSLQSCSSSSDDNPVSPVTPPTPVVTPTSISGTVTYFNGESYDAALSGATVKVTDASGKDLASDVIKTDKDGNFSASLNVTDSVVATVTVSGTTASGTPCSKTTPDVKIVANSAAICNVSITDVPVSRTVKLADIPTGDGTVKDPTGGVLAASAGLIQNNLPVQEETEGGTAPTLSKASVVIEDLTSAIEVGDELTLTSSKDIEITRAESDYRVTLNVELTSTKGNKTTLNNKKIKYSIGASVQPSSVTMDGVEITKENVKQSADQTTVFFESEVIGKAVFVFLIKAEKEDKVGFETLLNEITNGPADKTSTFNVKSGYETIPDKTAGKYVKNLLSADFGGYKVTSIASSISYNVPQYYKTTFTATQNYQDTKFSLVGSSNQYVTVREYQNVKYVTKSEFLGHTGGSN